MNNRNESNESNHQPWSSVVVFSDSRINPCESFAPVTSFSIVTSILVFATDQVLKLIWPLSKRKGQMMAAAAATLLFTFLLLFPAQCLISFAKKEIKEYWGKAYPAAMTVWNRLGGIHVMGHFWVHCGSNIGRLHLLEYSWGCLWRLMQQVGQTCKVVQGCELEYVWQQMLWHAVHQCDAMEIHLLELLEVHRIE